MMLGLYVFDGVQYIRIDRIEAIQETFQERRTDAYAVDGPKMVREATRHVTTLSGGQFSSPGTAEDFLRLCEDVSKAYAASQGDE